MNETATSAAPHSIELSFGYKDPKGATHKTVTFGRRLTGADLFRVDADPQAATTTQYNLLLLRASITSFGTMKMPAPLPALLKLDSIDLEYMADAHNEFSARGLDGRAAESLSDDKVKLALGYDLDGVVYDIVTFGTRLTGMDEIAADKLGLTGIKRLCYLIGRQVVQLSQSDGELSLDGALGLDVFEKLDAVDVMALQTAAEKWKYSFRRTREVIPTDGSLRGNDFVN